MPFVVTEACIKCKYTDCVNVCPMDCFVEGPNFLVIDPSECIDCSVCVPECPVEAIINANEISENQAAFVELNAQLANDPNWKPIKKSKAPLAEHESWASVKDKLAHPTFSSLGSLRAMRQSFARQAPNPSIERTSPGKPGAASHLKRWASVEAPSGKAAEPFVRCGACEQME